MKRLTKLAAVAAVALGTAAPMAMAGTFATGTITKMDTMKGTVSIDGATFHMNSGAAKGMFKVGDVVLYKVQTKGATNDITAMKAPTGMDLHPAPQAASAAQANQTGTPNIAAAPQSGEQKAAANGLAGDPSRAMTVPAEAHSDWSGGARQQAQAEATGGATAPVTNIVD